MGKYVTVDTGDLDRWVAQTQEAAGGGMRKELVTIKEEVALRFLDAVVDEIYAVGSFDTGRLANSFGRGAADNVWKVGDSGLEIEAGTNVSYADWANTGHWQRPGRFVPGRWAGDKFIYEPGAKTGMVLKASWVEGSHYFDDALKLYGAEYVSRVEKLLQDALKRLFN